jgi:cytochrome b subunit of formate dehydrogenase
MAGSVVAAPNRSIGVDPASRGYHVGDPDREVIRMPVWAWILIIVLLVLLVTGGVGYGRR